MTKADIAGGIVLKTHIPEKEVETVINEFMLSVKSSLSKGESVYLRGFGTFMAKKRGQKTGRNILSGKAVIIPAHFIPAFKPSDSFKEKVRESGK